MKEDAFIFNAARLYLAEDNIAALKELAENGLDWSAVAKKASSHGVSQFMYYAFKQHDLTGLLPEEVLKKFKAEYYETAIKNAKRLEEFKSIVSILPNKVIPIKGIELIQSLYPNIAIRSMCDIDLLVEKEYVEENWNRLREFGYTSSLPLQAVKKSQAHGELLETCLHLPPLCKKLAVEVHRSLFQDSRFQEVMRQALASSVKINDNRHQLTQEMMLIHLCTHFFKHVYYYMGVVLRELCDINELLRKHEKTLDWHKIEQICTESELRHEVATGLSYAHILLDAPIPEQFLAEKVLKNREAILSSFLREEVYLEKIRMPLLKRLKSYFVSLRQLPSPAAKAAFIFRTFVPQKEWMAGKYDVSTAGKLAMAYPRYWLKLVNVYLIGGR